MSFGRTIALATGAKIPQIGLGTWQSKRKEVENAVEFAVRHGYRHLDLAMVYQNQEEVGAALKKVIPSVVKREELFITSKLWNTSHQPADIEKELDFTLGQLGLDYLDLYLVHWPVAFTAGSKVNPLFPPHPTKPGEVEIDSVTSLVDTWKEFIKLPATGKVKSIGVSNFTTEHLEAIIKATGIVPAANQVEAHPCLPQDDLVAYCKEKNIHLSAYSPLGNNTIEAPLLVEEPFVKSIANKLGATPAQVLIAWGVYRGYSVLPKSVHNDRIASNFKQIELSQEDYDALTAFGKKRQMRFNVPYVVNKPKWGINVFGGDNEKSAEHQVKTV